MDTRMGRLKLLGAALVLILILGFTALMVYQNNAEKSRYLDGLTATSARLFLDSIATDTPTP